VVHDAAGRLLTVREVADRLWVSRATVFWSQFALLTAAAEELAAVAAEPGAPPSQRLIKK
jgi:hypothetical protein